jgi:AbiJ N-terminal domain 5/Abortive infection C-terminus
MISRRPLGGSPVDTDMKVGFNGDTAILALQRAIKGTFDDGRWHELGYLVGKHDLIASHGRLLRSLHWGDEDYGSCIFNVLPELLGDDFRSLRTMEEFVGLKEWLRKNDPKLYADLYADDVHELVVSLEHVEKAAGIHDVLELNRHAARIRHGIADDPAQAIGSAKELLETVLKTVIGDHEQKSRDDIPDLLKKAQAQLDLDPRSASGSETLRRTLSNLGQVVHGVAELRSLYGTGHGRSKSRELEIAHARLVVNAAITVATFLLEIWQQRHKP